MCCSLPVEGWKNGSRGVSLSGVKGRQGEEHEVLWCCAFGGDCLELKEAIGGKVRRQTAWGEGWEVEA